jgi:hypothetical protein
MITKNKDSLFKYFTAIYSCFFYAHYSLLNLNFSPTNLPFIFFGTIFSYNLLQTSKINWYLLILSGLSSLILPTEMMLQYSLIAFITLVYPKYLRPHYILKPLAIAISWCLLFKSTDMIVYLESFFLILALSLPFDLRDKYDDKELITFAHILNKQKFKVLCSILWLLYLLMKISSPLQEISMIDYIVLSLYYYYINKTITPNSSRLKTYVLLDFTIALQLFLTYLK